MENLHRDYKPIKVKSYLKSSKIGGIIIRLRFRKVNNLKFYQYLFRPVKDIYYWLPYISIIAVDKYSQIGPKKRFPYSNVWFEVKETSEIYEQGLWDFIFHQQKLYKHSKEIRLSLPFVAGELLTVTRKQVIRTLDEFTFHKTMQQHRVRLLNQKVK